MDEIIEVIPHVVRRSVGDLVGDIGCDRVQHWPGRDLEPGKVQIHPFDRVVQRPDPVGGVDLLTAEIVQDALGREGCVLVRTQRVLSH
jgi:hypothetical protein